VLHQLLVPRIWTVPVGLGPAVVTETWTVNGWPATRPADIPVMAVVVGYRMVTGVLVAVALGPLDESPW